MKPDCTCTVITIPIGPFKGDPLRVVRDTTCHAHGDWEREASRWSRWEKALSWVAIHDPVGDAPDLAELRSTLHAAVRRQLGMNPWPTQEEIAAENQAWADRVADDQAGNIARTGTLIGRTIAAAEWTYDTAGENERAILTLDDGRIVTFGACGYDEAGATIDIDNPS